MAKALWTFGAPKSTDRRYEPFAEAGDVVVIPRLFRVAVNNERLVMTDPRV